MCPLIIPYRFVPGTYAKAEEVNDNFAQTKQFVDLLETNVAEHDLSIMQLDTNKADINGNNSEVFRVANPIGDFDAINKQTMMDNLWVTQETIRGLRVTKASNNQVNISEGGCYDSTMKYLMRSYDTITTEAQTLTANTTYYVYLIGNDTGDVDGILSLNSGSPSLPVGYNLYRNIANLVTDANGNILSINDTNAVQEYSDYLIFPNKTCFQWGRVSGFSFYGQTKTVTFPRQFIDYNIRVMIGSNICQDTGDKGSTMSWKGITNTQLTLFCGVQGENADGSTGGYSNIKVDWLAIGKVA